MDELIFRKRVYANPNSIDQDLVDAVRANPALQKILDEVLAFDGEVAAVANAVAIPPGLQDRLTAIPESAAATAASKPSSNNFFQYYALAASLIFAVGIGVIVTFGDAPSTNEVVFGNEVIQHLYHEMNEIDAIHDGSSRSAVSMPALKEVMALADTQFNDEQFLQTMPVRFAKPCEVLPSYHSAHLMLQGSNGAINVIVINNSPVANEYSIRDDRFSGVVIPMGNGNLILIGEKNENLDRYKTMFAQNVEWVI